MDEGQILEYLETISEADLSEQQIIILHCCRSWRPSAGQQISQNGKSSCSSVIFSLLPSSQKVWSEEF